jgi:hypothetical protein
MSQCKACRFYSPKHGECRRRAPQAMLSRDGNLIVMLGALVAVAVKHAGLGEESCSDAYTQGSDNAAHLDDRQPRWPEVMETDWCGEWAEQ